MLSDAQSGENEWPLPATRTVAPALRAWRTRATISSSFCGLTTACGAHVTLPDQLVHDRVTMIFAYFVRFGTFGCFARTAA
jgi:hypothetical protein